MKIQPLHPDFGAEILKFDVNGQQSPEQIAQIRAALDEFQLLVLRSDEVITPDRQVEITSWFGPPVDDGFGNGRLWSVLHNDDAAGAIKLPFHSDFSYTDSPIQIITLHGVEVPPGGTSTSFVSGIRGWATLPSDQQDRLAPLTLRHRHVSEVVADWPEFVAEHPLCKPHPRTGRPILFVTEHHADRITELNEEESQAVLAGLFDHMYGDAHVYTHRWRLHDLVIWDNLAVQHARREPADPSQGARAVQRVIVNDVTFAELIDRARKQEARVRLGA